MSLLNEKSFSDLASLNLDEEGAKILQEMVDAIQLAIEKCNELEAFILRNSDKAKPLPVNVAPVGLIKVAQGLEKTPEVSVGLIKVAQGLEKTPEVSSNSHKKVKEEVNQNNIKTSGNESNKPAVPINPDEPPMPHPLIIKEEKIEEVMEPQKCDDLQLNISDGNISQLDTSTEEFKLYVSLNKDVSSEKILDFLHNAKIKVVQIKYMSRGHYCFCFVQVVDKLDYTKCLELDGEGMIDGSFVTIRPYDLRRSQTDSNKNQRHNPRTNQPRRSSENGTDISSLDSYKHERANTSENRPGGEFSRDSICDIQPLMPQVNFHSSRQGEWHSEGEELIKNYRNSKIEERFCSTPKSRKGNGSLPDTSRGNRLQRYRPSKSRPYQRHKNASRHNPPS